jgi:hypothetical protein
VGGIVDEIDLGETRISEWNRSDYSGSEFALEIVERDAWLSGIARRFVSPDGFVVL